MSPTESINEGSVQDLIVKIIKFLHLAVINVRLYPPKSEIITNSLQNILQPLSTYFKENKTLLLAESEGNLLVNNQILEAKGAEKTLITDFAFSLADREIKSITFKRGLTLEELQVFVECLSKKGEQLRDEGGIVEILKRKQITNIILNETIYVAMVKDEVEEDLLLEQKGEEIQAIIKLLEKNAETISAMTDAVGKKEILKRIAQRILDFNPTVLMEFFDHVLPSQVEKMEIKKVILEHISAEKIEEIFNKMVALYQDSIRDSSSPAEVEEKTLPIKKFIERIITSPEAKNVPYQIYDEIYQKGLLKKMPEWITEKKQLSPVEKVRQLLAEKTPFPLIESTLQKDPSLISSLCLYKRIDLLKLLLTRIVAEFEGKQPEERRRAAQLLETLFDLLTQEGEEVLLNFLVKKLTEQIEREKNPTVYNELTHPLIKRANQYLLKGEYGKLGELIDVFRRHHSLEGELVVERYELSRRALERMAQTMEKVLISDLISSSPEKQYKSSQVILKLGKTMIPFLMRIIKETGEIRVRKIAAHTLKNMGEEGKGAILKELNPMTSLEELSRLLEAFLIFEPQLVVSQLEILLSHPDEKIKQLVIENLAKVDILPARQLLLDQLETKNLSLRIKIVRLLGELHSAEAIEKMITLMKKTSSPELQREICAVFEKIGDKRIVPFLLKRLKKKKKVFFWQKKLSPSVIVAIIWILRNFLTPEVKSVLTKLKQDKNPAIKRMAEKVLKFSSSP
jgi:HEAT repeat protein